MSIHHILLEAQIMKQMKEVERRYLKMLKLIRNIADFGAHHDEKIMAWKAQNTHKEASQLLKEFEE